MAARRQKPGAERAKKARWQGEVILDVIFENGLLFLSVENLGDVPARRVSVAFDRPLVGVGGRIDVSALGLFRNLEFLAPRKSIRTLLDTSESWFGRESPTRFTAHVSYLDASGRRRRVTIEHDLEIYRDVGWVAAPKD